MHTIMGHGLCRHTFLLFAEMRHHGVMSLKVTVEWDSTELQSAVKPDQNKRLPMWMPKVANDSLRKLLKHIRFRAPVEMLSLYACVMNNTTIVASSITQIRKQAGEIRRVRRSMYEQIGREDHNAMALRSAMAG